MARGTQAPPLELSRRRESAAGRRWAASPGAAGPSDRGLAPNQDSRQERHCQDAQAGDTTADRLAPAGEEIPHKTACAESLHGEAVSPGRRFSCLACNVAAAD